MLTAPAGWAVHDANDGTHEGLFLDAGTALVVDKACDMVSVNGIDRGGQETEIYYSADCSAETGDKPAWH